MSRRILMLITDLEIGGTPTVVRELAIRLNDPPHVVVEVACLKGPGPVADQIRNAGIDVTALGARSVLSLPNVVFSLRKLIKQRNFDTVVSFLIHANAVATMAMRPLHDVRLFQSIQTTQENPRWHWWLQGQIESRAERFIAPSRAIARAAKTRSGIAESRFDIIPNAIDPDEFPRQIVFAGETVRLGFLGRIDPVKRLSVAIEAVRRIGDPSVELHVFGAGHDPGVDLKTVRWHGPVKRPQEALSQMDCLILPSIGEGFGLVLIEAMAAGVPVIASAAGAIPEVVRDEWSGILVPVGPDEVSRFAVAVERLRSDRQFREHLIANGLSDVQRRFTWEVVLPEYQRSLS
jgi:glycosyltransferase involved in cell wall biosynthesis